MDILGIAGTMAAAQRRLLLNTSKTSSFGERCAASAGPLATSDRDLKAAAVTDGIRTL
jgi:hypothetical protein